MSVLVHPSQSQKGIDWHQFLGRPALPAPTRDALDAIRNRSIFITGAGGSIGSLLSLRLARIRPRRLTLLDSSEQALYRLRACLAAEDLVDQATLRLGSVTDIRLLQDVFQSTSPDTIFHAAAHKHLPLLEEHPLAAIANNTLATNTLLRVGAEHRIRRMILLSTDKAVAPVSVLGLTKHVAEMDTIGHGGIVLRLVNVLGTHGSVVPAFLNQIAADQPVTITHPAAKRYFLTPEEAVDMLLTASIDAPLGATLVPAVFQSQSIVELARFLLAHCSPASSLGVFHASESARESTGNPRKESEARGMGPGHLGMGETLSSALRYIGLSAGEKQDERLWSADEVLLAESFHDSLRVIARRRTIEKTISLDAMLETLRIAVTARDLSKAMTHMQSLVPDYVPSSTVLQQLRMHPGAN